MVCIGRLLCLAHLIGFFYVRRRIHGGIETGYEQSRVAQQEGIICKIGVWSIGDALFFQRDKFRQKKLPPVFQLGESFVFVVKEPHGHFAPLKGSVLIFAAQFPTLEVDTVPGKILTRNLHICTACIHVDFGQCQHQPAVGISCLRKGFQLFSQNIGRLYVKPVFPVLLNEVAPAVETVIKRIGRRCCPDNLPEDR